MTWAPAESADVLIVAAPLTTGCPVPIGVPPSLNNTVPTGLPAVLVTCAVNVTDCPRLAGFFDDCRFVMVLACATVSASKGEVLPRELVSPEYVAVMLWEPAFREEIPNVTLSPWTGSVPRTASPSLKVIVPVGGPI